MRQARLHAILWALWRSARRGAWDTLRQQPLRAVTAIGIMVVVWALIGGLAWGLLAFLGQPQYALFKPRLVETLLALFAYALLLLVTMSDVVLVWAGLFRTRAAAFVATLPLTERDRYWAAAIEGGGWSAWGVAVLALPLIAVLASEAEQPLRCVAAALITGVSFVGVCVAAGALGALLLARLLPILQRRLTWILVGAGAVVVAAVAIGAHQLGRNLDPGALAGDVAGRLAFAQNPYLPPRWAQGAISAALSSRWSEWARLTALLAATAATLSIGGEALAARRLARERDRIQSRGETSGPRRTRSKPWRLPPLLPADVALLAAKDLRLFFREPAQVLQLGLFVAVLLFYLLMLPRMSHAFLLDPTWRPAVSLLNLIAIAMALATFTGRFVYPLLSLEGRRLWILAAAPWPRSRVVTAKFVVALGLGLPVAGGLTILSGAMLALPWTTTLAQVGAITALAAGLSACALGLGAYLADYQQDNAAKLVAGYGGTVNLLASLVFTALVIGGSAVLVTTLRGALGPTYSWSLAVMWVAVITLLWTWSFLRLAWRSFGQLDRVVHHAGTDAKPR